MDFWVTPRRYEVKIALAFRDAAEVEAWVHLHPLHWQIAYPSRQVNNIYFDTADYQGLNANLSGISERTKLRLRWYGTNLPVVQDGNLELKCKQGVIGWKEICRFNQPLDLAEMPWRDVERILRMDLPSQGQRWLNWAAYPALINSYHRAYYVMPDQSVRLTLDTSLRAFDQRFSGRPNLNRVAPLVDYVVLELKADHAHYAQLSEALRYFPVRVDRFSKYVQGLLSAPDFS
jgi:hypothetical protein